MIRLEAIVAEANAGTPLAPWPDEYQPAHWVNPAYVVNVTVQKGSPFFIDGVQQATPNWMATVVIHGTNGMWRGPLRPSIASAEMDANAIAKAVHLALISPATFGRTRTGAT